MDRVACPWLIRRFVDPAAEFLYVPPDQVAAVASREGAIPYDVPRAHRPRRRHRGEGPHPRVAGPGGAERFRLVYGDDHELLERELPVYDALYAYCRGRLERAGS